MKVLYIDDTRFPEYFHQIGARIDVARTYNEAIELIDAFRASYDLISLDHDLGEEKTGYDIAKYIVENQIEIPPIAIHSANPVGRFNIEQLLTHYGYKVIK